jgi:hypothetical protein
MIHRRCRMTTASRQPKTRNPFRRECDLTVEAVDRRSISSISTARGASRSVGICFAFRSNLLIRRLQSPAPRARRNSTEVSLLINKGLINEDRPSNCLAMATDMGCRTLVLVGFVVTDTAFVWRNWRTSATQIRRAPRFLPTSAVHGPPDAAAVVLFGGGQHLLRRIRKWPQLIFIDHVGAVSRTIAARRLIAAL